MSKVTGRIFLLNEDGDSQREIDVNQGQSEVVGGTFGSLVVDATKTPPLIQGKGNVFIIEENIGVRTTRLTDQKPSVEIGISGDGKSPSNIGSVRLER